MAREFEPFEVGWFEVPVLADDIDELAESIRNGSVDLVHDMDGNQIVDDADRLFWVTDIKDTFLGDANLDGTVDRLDFVSIGTNDGSFIPRLGEFKDPIVTIPTKRRFHPG